MLRAHLRERQVLKVIAANGRLPDAGRAREHLLDFDRNPIAVNEHNARGNRHIVGEDFHLIGFSGIQLNNCPTREAHHLMNGHRAGAEHDHEVDLDFVESAQKAKSPLGHCIILWLANRKHREKHLTTHD